MTITLNSRADFTLEAARRVAWGGEGVVLGEAAQRAMAEARTRFLRLIEEPEVIIYGVTSGYGQNARVRLAPEERTVLRMPVCLGGCKRQVAFATQGEVELDQRVARSGNERFRCCVDLRVLVREPDRRVCQIDELRLIFEQFRARAPTAF